MWWQLTWPNSTILHARPVLEQVLERSEWVPLVPSALFLWFKWCRRGRKARSGWLEFSSWQRIDSWLWEGFLDARGEVTWNKVSGVQVLLSRIEIRWEVKSLSNGREGVKRWRVAGSFLLHHVKLKNYSRLYFRLAFIREITLTVKQIHVENFEREFWFGVLLFVAVFLFLKLSFT